MLCARQKPETTPQGHYGLGFLSTGIAYVLVSKSPENEGKPEMPLESEMNA